ncbi:MAG: sulfite exporter TauE/SafE family protein [Planctomycetota bacterium]
MSRERPLEPIETLIICGIGLTAGFFGALAGLGGSLFMLPLLSILLGHERYHLFMAAAMCVNVMISLPAAYRHWRKGATRFRTLVWVLPTMIPAIAAGVLLSNRFDGVYLARTLGVLIMLSILIQLILPKLVGKQAKAPNSDEPTAEPEDRSLRTPYQKFGMSGIGGITGFISGLMGIGGGVVLVSGGQIVGGLPIRRAIANSSAAICITAAIGGFLKVATIGEHGFSITEPLALAAIMGAWGVLGAIAGVEAVHLVPQRILRWVVGLVLILAALRLATTPSNGGEDSDISPSAQVLQMFTPTSG